MNHSSLKAAQRSVFKLLLLFFVLATAIHKINYQDLNKENAIIT